MATRGDAKVLTSSTETRSRRQKVRTPDQKGSGRGNGGRDTISTDRFNRPLFMNAGHIAGRLSAQRGVNTQGRAPNRRRAVRYAPVRNGLAGAAADISPHSSGPGSALLWN